MRDTKSFPLSATGAACALLLSLPLASMAQGVTGYQAGQGGSPVGMDALNSVRLESGVAWYGHDFDDKQIPHEAGLEHSHISYEKGCYTGQEIVERVRSRGHANRRLTLMRFSADEAPDPGTKLLFAGSDVGNVTSTAFSPILKQRIGLGYVRREHAGCGTSLDASGIAAEVISPPALTKNISS